MRLNLKRTALVGLAFLSICTFWGLYDFVVPLLLRNTYGLGDTFSGAVMAMDNVVALFLLPFFGTLSDKCTLRLGRRMPFILCGTVCAAALLVYMPTAIGFNSLPLFLVMLALLLLAMGSYRSPAVALMPDVTPKPLRSSGNAVINLMGAIGTVASLGLIQVAVIRTTDEAGVIRSDYSLLFYLVAAIMVICIAVLALTIRERKLALPPDEPEAPAATDGPTAVMHKLRPEVKRSLALLLVSVALWFMGYNAVTSAFSKYALAVWGVSESAAAGCVMVASVGAIVSYWPVAMLASRFGRKKLILSGIVMLLAAFLFACSMPQMNAMAYVAFVVVGCGWAAINVNSYPMVVEMASGADTGKYTGYYYTFSMSAQVLTPILSGALLEHIGYWTLFPYAAVMVVLAFITMSFVRHGDNRPAAPKGLEALDVEA